MRLRGTAIARSLGLQTAAPILAIRPRREVWRRCGFGREKHRKSANAHGLSQSVAERCGGALGGKLPPRLAGPRDHPEGAASQTAEVCILGLLPRGPDSSGTREGHASGSAGLQQSALEPKARFNPCRDSAACTIGMQRQRGVKSCCFSDDQTLSLVILPRHGSGFLRGFSSVDESACNPKPKEVAPSSRNPYSWRAQRFGELQLGASVEEGGKTGLASNPPSAPRVDSNHDGIHGFGSG
jgi:hypothetical protein